MKSQCFHSLVFSCCGVIFLIWSFTMKSFETMELIELSIFLLHDCFPRVSWSQSQLQYEFWTTEMGVCLLLIKSKLE